MSHTAQFNPLPLLSVKPGISGSLEQIERDLKTYFAAPTDNQVALQNVVSEIHRVCGVLQMISLRGVTVYCGEIEKLLGEIASGNLSPTPSHQDIIQRALFSLSYYLDALIDGASNATLRLFHQYQELQQARGVELSFETDLFFPELNVKLPPSVLGVPLDADSYPRIKFARSQYQQSLLKWLRHDNPENALQNMGTAVLTVMGCVPQDQRRAFWWISAGLLDCLAHSGTPPELNVKSVLSRIDMQMKALLENTPVDAYSTTCEMLYLLARSHTVSEIVDDIKRTFALEDYLPEESSRSPSETDQLLDQIRTLLGAARESWEKCLQDKDARACKAFSEQIQQLRPLAEGLGRNTLQFLCNQIHTAATHCVEPESAQLIGQDMAMALLLLEIGIDQYSHLGSNFHDQARILGQRLQSAQTRAPGEEESFADMVALHSEMEKRKILGPLATEMQDNLQHVEQGLNSFFNDPSKRSELNDLWRLLHQVLAAMYLLSLDQAAQLLRSLEQAVKRYLAGNNPTPTEMRAVAIALSALEAYVENMAHGQESDVSPLNSALQVILALQQPPPAAKPASPTATAAPPAAATTTPAPAAPSAAGEELGGNEDMLEVFLEEAREVLQSLRTNLETSFLHPESLEPLVTIRRGFHTLKGSGRMVGLADLGEVAWATEKAMNKWLADNKPATPALLKFISDAEKLFGAWVGKLDKGEAAFFDYAALITTAQQIADGVELVSAQASEPQAAPIAQPPQEPTVSLELASIPEPELEAPLMQEPGFTLEPEPEVQPVPQLEPEPIFELNLEPLPEQEQIEAVGTPESKSAELVHISTQEAAQNVAALQHHLAALGTSSPPVISYDFMRAAHTLGGVYRVMGFVEAANLAQSLESWLQERMEKSFTLNEAQSSLLEKVVATLANLVQAMGNQQEYPVPPGLVAQLSADIMPPHVEARPVPKPEPVVARANPPAAEISVPPPVAASPAPQPEVAIAHAEQAAADAMDERTVHDDLDEQLLPVFLEEAADLYTQISTNVQSWMEHPGSEKYGQNLQRALHTLKGSARMAGAMRLGELTHITETFVDKPSERDAAFWTALQDYFDRIGNTLHLLRSGGAPSEVAAAAKPAAGAPEAAARAAARPALEQSTGSAAAMLRVRSDIIDFLVNEAGEISVSRSRIETEMGAVKIGLVELTSSVERLRKQLREIEIQAEAQMQARANVLHESEQQFDPLEFDRFTQFQDLTRSMTESVHDVQTVQQTLLKSLDETGAALTAQAALNRELQQRLMSIRTVPFSTISERLYRIIRRTGKELGKKVNLELLGGDVELDRSVLEKMTASFEHLLRNSIDHGLESAEQRVKNNKPPVGEIRLSVRQENNEVEFEFVDDGAGLDTDLLYKKAVEQGIFQAGEVVSDKQIMQTIFITGLSTAKQVTEISGRGVGMDVVHSDITSLGGRIDVFSERGKGARFVIRLPLTLAVAQAILVESGHDIFALNSGMVDQVLQVKHAELVSHFDKGEVEWHGNHYPLFNLTRMLGNDEYQPESRLYNPILLLRSGERRMAVHVDELINNQEVVVKNVGPQLARLPGIAGATVLGNGKVVLILNPIALEQYASGIQKLTKAKSAAAPVTVSATKMLVMVVDDSLTVRKVTSRMLVRAGYNVVAANDGVDALEKLAEFTPDMLLLDIEMPRMDGFELTKRLRSDPKYKDLPIIIITSRAAEKHRQYALELGVNAYLGKPYQEMELLEHVKFYSDEELRSQANFHRADSLLQQIAGFISAKTDG